MKAKKSARQPFRGWLPPEPQTWGRRLKKLRFPVAFAIATTLLVTSALLIYSNLFSSPSMLPSASQSVPLIPVSAVTSQTYGQISAGSSYLGGDKDDWGYSIKLTSDDGLIMAGVTTSYGAGGKDMWLIKTSPASYTMSNGVSGAYQKVQWNVTFGGKKDDGALAVIQTSDGGFAAAGFTSSFGAGQSDMWLVKTDADGRMQWNMTYGGSGNDSANSLLQTSDGGYLLVGYTNSGVQSQASLVVKTDASGNMEWQKTLPGNDATSVVETDDGNYALAVQYPDSFGLVIIDSSGNILLNQTYPAPADQAYAQAIALGVDGGYAIAGWTTHSSTGVNDTWLVKTDDAGQEQWNRTYPGLAGFALIKTDEGGYALTGDRAYLIITDSSGNVEWDQTYDSETGNGSQYFTRMQSIIEASPDHFVMVGFQNTLTWSTSGPYTHYQLLWIQVALKSGTQTVPPQTTILSPTNTIYDQRNIPLAFFVNQPAIYFMYSVNGYSNISIAGNTTLTNLPNGEYNLTVFSTDANYNTAPSQTVTFAVNSAEPYVPPNVTIQSPINQTYSYGSQLNLVYSVTQPVFWTAYSIDGGANMTAFPNLILNPLTNGTHTITVYAGDIAGGQAGKATVSFSVLPPSEPSYVMLNPPGANYANRLNEAIRSAIHIFITPTFWLIVGFALAASIGGVIVVAVLLTRKTSN